MRQLKLQNPVSHSIFREGRYHPGIKIPDDIIPSLREIDQSLKDHGVPPHFRPIMAVIEFGKKFHISIPLAKLPPGAPPELVATSTYTDRIHRWYQEVYGDLIKTDFSQKAKVAGPQPSRGPGAWGGAFQSEPVTHVSGRSDVHGPYWPLNNLFECCIADIRGICKTASCSNS